MKLVILLILCTLPLGILFAQDADSLYTIPADSGIQVSPFYNVNPGDSLSSDTLLQTPGKKDWGKEIYRLISSSPNYQGTKDNYKFNRINYFENYEGKIIRNISVRQLDVFGPDVYDTTAKPKYWFEKLGNSLHISTIRSSIRNQLFLTENERIDAFVLAENERILRELPNIHDSRIYLIPVGQSDSVDVVIFTKDLWPVGLGMEVLDIDYGNVSMWNTNILGLGHILELTAQYNLNEEQKYGYAARYKVPNIVNSFISIDLFHEDKWNVKSNKIYLSRNIITPAIRLGGGAGYENIDQIKDIRTFDSTMYNVNYRYEYLDYWLGYAFPFFKPQNFKLKNSLFISARMQSYHFFNRPSVNRNLLYSFHQRKIYLTSIGYTVQGYQNTRLIYGFGDTEDLPYGAMIKLTGGIEKGEFYQRFYTGFSFAYSGIINQVGYLSASIDMGGFLRKYEEQGVLSTNFLYISPLIGRNKHLFRCFTQFQYEQGYNRYIDEFVEQNKNRGVRGVSYDSLRGNIKTFVNTDFVYYSPFDLYGFRFVFYAYVDVGYINNQFKTLIKNDPYSSIGIGVRVRNEKLVFNTLQIRLSFFPASEWIPDENKETFEVSGTPKYRMPDFSRHRPEIIPFK